MCVCVHVYACKGAGTRVWMLDSSILDILRNSTHVLFQMGFSLGRAHLLILDWLAIQGQVCTRVCCPSTGVTSGYPATGLYPSLLPQHWNYRWPPSDRSVPVSASPALGLEMCITTPRSLHECCIPNSGPHKHRVGPSSFCFCCFEDGTHLSSRLTSGSLSFSAHYCT